MLRYTAKCRPLYRGPPVSLSPVTGLFQKAVWQNADGSGLVCDACTEIPGCKPAVQAKVKD